MKKYIVETYYTCTFKTVHTLDSLDDAALSKIDKRTDGDVEVIDVKLNNRKTIIEHNLNILEDGQGGLMDVLYHDNYLYVSYSENRGSGKSSTSAARAVFNEQKLNFTNLF